jgi:aromatic-L-amino-acid decarboxylase
MDIDEFRTQGHKLVDWMADYLAGIEQYPVRSQVRPGDIAAQLPETPPQAGEAMDDIFADFQSIVMPGISHWQHPRWLAYFPASSSPPSLLAEMLTGALAANCMLWETSPAGTEMEGRVLDWLRQMIGLPTGFEGVIQDTASAATFCAILCARERALGWDGNDAGLSGEKAVAFYASAESHSSVEKGIRMAGVGSRYLRQIDVDENFAMRPEALEAAIAADRKEGILPAGVIATLGTTGVGGIDPLEQIGEICARENIYLHVDAAWAGSALLLEEHRWMLEGIERADSFVFNPHKWLLTNFDCSAHFVRDADVLKRTLSILPEYLKTREGGTVTDYRDWGVPLGRRFRALKLWFVIRSYGVEGLKENIAGHIALTAELAELIQREEDFELTTPAVLGLLTFRYRPANAAPDTLDALNDALLTRINDDGRTYLTRGKAGDKLVIRLCVGAPYTKRRHVMEAWEAIREIARAM